MQMIISKKMVKFGGAFFIAMSFLPPLISRAQEQKSQIPEQKNLIESLNGATLYRAYCATCHGADAKGAGPAASALKAQVPDLTQISRRNGGQFSAARVQQFISGDKLPPAHGSREMPIWGPIFGQIAWDQDLGKIRIYNLTKYIESLQRK
jgi:mono/diheme cytochrome c family protein